MIAVHPKDLVGGEVLEFSSKKYGKWEVLAITRSRRNHTYWIIVCLVRKHGKSKVDRIAIPDYATVKVRS